MPQIRTWRHCRCPSEVVWFDQPQGWHMRGDIVHRGEQAVFDTRITPLPGRHNRGNLCAVLAALEALGRTRWRWHRRCRISARCRTACSASAWPMA